MGYFIIGFFITGLLIIGIWIYKKRSNLSMVTSNGKITKEKTTAEEVGENTDLIINENELWSIREINNEGALQPFYYTELNTSKELNNNISKLLKKAPKSTREILKKQDTTYLLSFSEETVQAISEGNLELMQAKRHLSGVRGQAVDQKGRVVEQGVLKPSNVKKLNPTQVAMGVLTTVTAQEHLQQIGNQLQKLNSKVNKIISSIDNKQIGNDKGNIDYLKTIFTGLNEGNYTNEDVRDYRQQLETIIRTTMQDLNTVKEGFAYSNYQLENEKLKGVWSANKETESIEDLINNYEKQSNIYLSKLDVILVCLSLSKYLNLNYSADTTRLDYVQKKLLDLEKDNTQFFKKVKEVAPNIGARIRLKREKYNSDKQKRIEKQALKLRNHFDSQKKEFEWRVEKTKNDDFYSDTFVDGSAEYKITMDKSQTVKSIKKVKYNKV